MNPGDTEEGPLYDPEAFYISLWTDKDLLSGLTSTLPKTREEIVIPPESFEAVAQHLDEQFVTLARRLLPHLKKEPRWGLPTAKVVGDDVPERLIRSPELAPTIDIEAAEHSEVARQLSLPYLFSVKEWIPPDDSWWFDLESNALLFDELMDCLEQHHRFPRPHRYSDTGWICNRCGQEIDPPST